MPGPLKLRQVVIIGGGVLVMGAVLAAAYYAKSVADARSVPHSADPLEIAARVTVCELAAHELPVRLNLRGFLEGFAEVRVHAEVVGPVASREVADGDAVKAQDPLCRVDDTFHRIAVEQAEAGVRAAQADHEQAQAAIEAAAAHLEELQACRKNARIEFDRVDRLYQEQHAPQIEFDRAETVLQQASAAARAAEAALRRAVQQRSASTAAIALAQAKLARAAETLSRCVIRSPLAGRVDRLLVEQGEYVVPGQPVADVIRLDCMKLFVELSGRELALLGDDVTVRIVPDAEPETVYPATLHHIAPRADPVSRKFRLEVHLDNPDGALRSGSFAECRLTADKSRRIVTLPSSAVIHRHGQDYCHVAVNEGGHLRARVRPIETRPVPDLLDRVEVTGGLTPGERVVIGSQAELRDGSAIVTLGTEHAVSER